MTFQHVDTVLAFVALTLVASLVVTAGTQLVISLLGLRGANLRRSLADLFETASDDRDARHYSRVIARRVLRQPLVSGSVFSGLGLRLDELPFMPADAAGKLRWAGSGIPLRPWLLSALSGSLLCALTPFVITRLFDADFCASASVITNYIPFLNLCDHPWRSGAILGAVIGGLLSRWRLATSIRLDELVAVLEKLSAPAGGTLPDPAQRAMLVLAGETRSRTRPKMSPVSVQMERIFRDAEEDGEGGGGVAVAVEKAVTQVSGHGEPRVEGLNLWFEHAMDRASQRFTVQARVIAVVLSAVLVFAAHLDAIRIFQSLSSDAQERAQLAGGADALSKQAEQIARAKEGSRSAVPDVYRNAMVAVLEVAPAPVEQPKTKPRHSSRGNSAALRGEPEQISNSGLEAKEIQVSASSAQASAEAVQATPASAQAPLEPPAKGRESKAGKQTKSKAPAKEHERLVIPIEDRATVDAKFKAAKALASRPGFASREDADLWLRQTLDGDPAVDNLSASYQQEVNAELPSDGDKLIDQSASIKRDLARSEFRLLPEKWPDLNYTPHELPGLLIAVIFLSLCAPLCFNLLKGVASLRPLQKMK